MTTEQKQSYNNEPLPTVAGLAVVGTGSVKDAIEEIRQCAEDGESFDIYQLAAFRWVCHLNVILLPTHRITIE